MNHIIRLLVLSIALPTGAAAEVIPEGGGIIYGKDHAFSLKAPKDWALDNTSGAKSGLHAVFFPKESSWAKSKVVAYAQSRPLDTKVKSVQDAADFLVADFHAKGSPNHKGEKDGEIKTESGKVGITYKFTGDKFGNFEAVCYFQEKKTINYIVLSSRDKAAFTEAWEPFVALCKSYMYISDSVNEGTTKKGEKPSAGQPAPAEEPKSSEKKAPESTSPAPPPVSLWQTSEVRQLRHFATMSTTHSSVFCAVAFLLVASLEGQEDKSSTKPSTLETKAAEYMRERVRVNGFSGAVLMARGGQPVFRQSYGLANQEFNIPNTPTTKFRVGSVSKQFTAAAILLLEQTGKLQVTDRVSTYLPDWPKTWDEVTVHHLLSHTAGLPRLTTQALLDVSALSSSTPTPFRGVRDLLKPGEELQPLDSTPGEKWAYSNVGYIVLSMLIERVSGKSYGDFVSQELFRPLGMTDTGCEDPGTILRQRASGYTRLDEALANAPYVDVRFVIGAGSIYSTVDDLLLWNRALDSKRLLNASATDKLFGPVRNDYACGWWIQTKSNHRVQWHGGNVSGFVAQISRFPEEQLFIAILSNVLSGADRSQVRAMSTELAAIAFGESYELPRKHKEANIDRAAYDAYVGEYTGKDAFAIAREGERLMVQFPPGQSVFEIVPESATEFFWKGREYYLTFLKDETGTVTHASVRNEGEMGRWTKSR